MKSLSVKRIAAGIAGAAMIGAAFAAAAVDVDSSGLSNYKFFSGSSPDVKIVVGSSAAASDAVAAANIAAMVGSMAYTSEDITVLGKDGLTAMTNGSSGTVGEAGKVTLEFTLPGVSSQSAYNLKAYVDDNWDASADTTRDPGTNWDGDLSSGTVTGSPASVTGDKTALLQYGGKSYYALKNVGALTIQEEEKVYAFGKQQYYDTDDQVEARQVRVGYEVNFNDPLPYCVDTTKTNAGCATDDTVAKRQVTVKFLGQDWSIVTFSNGSSGVSLTLGKVDQYNPTMKIGDSVTAANGAKITLQDIGPPQGTTYLPNVAFGIVAKDGTDLGLVSVQSGSSKDVTAAGITVKVNDVVTGVSSTNFADVSVYSNKIDLQPGQKVGTAYGNWKVRITSSTTTGGGSQVSKIQLYDTTSDWNLKKGESVPIITGATALNLAYQGLDLQDTDYDPLTFTYVTGKSFPMDDSTGRNYTDAIQITSGKSNAFRPNALHGAGSAITGTDTIFVGTGLYTGNGTATGINQWGISNATRCGFFFYNSSGSTFYDYTAGPVPYYYTSDKYANIACSWVGNVANTTSWARMQITVPEYNEDSEATSSTAGDAKTNVTNVLFDVDGGNFYTTENSTTISSSGSVWAYNSTSPNKEVGYITPRGSVLKSFSSTNAQIWYALKTGHGLLQLTRGSAAAELNKLTLTLGQDESSDIDTGYSVMVKAIGQVTTGSGGSCVIDSATLAALAPSVDKAVTVAMLDTASSPLVVTDDVAGSGKAIAVGGPNVNSVSRAALASGSVDVSTAGSSPVVKVLGDKIVVAGYSAVDTMDAAKELIRWMSANRDAVDALR
jgi:hypothetical protein